MKWYETLFAVLIMFIPPFLFAANMMFWIYLCDIFSIPHWLLWFWSPVIFITQVGLIAGLAFCLCVLLGKENKSLQAVANYEPGDEWR